MAKTITQIIIDDINANYNKNENYNLGDLLRDILSNIAYIGYANKDRQTTGAIFYSIISMTKEHRKHYYKTFNKVIEELEKQNQAQDVQNDDHAIPADTVPVDQVDNIPMDVAVKDNALRPNAIIADDPQE